MFTPRRIAQCGLIGACVLLVICLSILIAGAADEHRSPNSSNSLAQEKSTLTLGSVDLLVSSK